MFLADGVPNLAFVCPSNCNKDSGIFTETIAVKPSLTSVPSKLLLFAFIKLYFLAYSLNTFVNPLLKPVSCVPPSGVLTRLTKEIRFS